MMLVWLGLSVVAGLVVVSSLRTSPAMKPENFEPTVPSEPGPSVTFTHDGLELVLTRTWGRTTKVRLTAHTLSFGGTRVPLGEVEQVRAVYRRFGDVDDALVGATLVVRVKGEWHELGTGFLREWEELPHAGATEDVAWFVDAVERRREAFVRRERGRSHHPALKRIRTAPRSLAGTPPGSEA